MAVHIEGPGSAQAQVGESVVVRLAETPTTGYQWEVVDPPDALTVASSEFVPPTSQAAGAGGRRVITLTPTAKGEHHLTLARRRAWEPAAAETCEIVVTVS